MGRWDWGLLDSDGALDGLGFLTDSAFKDLQKYERTRGGIKTAARVAAAMGMLLQFQPYMLTKEAKSWRPTCLRVLEKYDRFFDELGTPAAKLLRSIPSDAETLSKRRGNRPKELVEVLGNYVSHPRDECLFTHPDAKAYVQKMAKRCVRWTDRAIEEDGFMPLEEDYFLGPMVGLYLLEPWTLPKATIEAWHSLMTETALRDGVIDPKNPTPAKSKLSADELAFWQRMFRLIELLEARCDGG